jgi:hypothetical protein
MGYSRTRRVRPQLDPSRSRSPPIPLIIPPFSSSYRRFDRLRSLSYADTHVIMICFSVERPESLENVEAKWIGEVEHYCPDVVVILVGECVLEVEVPLSRALSCRTRTMGMRLIPRLFPIHSIPCRLRRQPSNVIFEKTHWPLNGFVNEGIPKERYHMKMGWTWPSGYERSGTWVSPAWESPSKPACEPSSLKPTYSLS